MKNKRVNPGQIWKQFEDVVAPGLRLSLIERAVYSHLLRHSLLEGKQRLRFSLAGLGRSVRLNVATVRKAVRRLAERGALRVIERSKKGHDVEVRLPEEIPGAGAERIEDHDRARMRRAADLEEMDFLQTTALRQAIHARECGACFYCLRRLAHAVSCLDHVVPQARSGGNSYRNLVSCCLECNSKKGERRAEDFLRWLYRERRLTDVELAGRLRALDALASGRMRPCITFRATLGVEREGIKEIGK